MLLVLEHKMVPDQDLTFKLFPENLSCFTSVWVFAFGCFLMCMCACFWSHAQLCVSGSFEVCEGVLLSLMCDTGFIKGLL